MDELGKVKRVIEKQAPVTEVLLVLDATTGQNGLIQARVFSEVVDVTGIVLTKLDGSAKGGIVVAVQRELGVPVKLVGLGEGPDDLAPFDARARSSTRCSAERPHGSARRRGRRVSSHGHVTRVGAELVSLPATRRGVHVETSATDEGSAAIGRGPPSTVRRRHGPPASRNAISWRSRGRLLRLHAGRDVARPDDDRARRWPCSTAA